MSVRLQEARRVDTSGFDNSMSEDQIHNWLTRQLNRSPELADFYYVGQTMFQAGAYGGAVRLLSLNVANGRGDLPAHHLLGHSLAIINERERAVSFLKNCVNKGFDDDWQLLIELQVELDTASQINYGPSNGDIVPSRASKTSLPSFSPSFNLPSSTPHKLPSQVYKTLNFELQCFGLYIVDKYWIPTFVQKLYFCLRIFHTTKFWPATCHHM